MFTAKGEEIIIPENTPVLILGECPLRDYGGGDYEGLVTHGEKPRTMYFHEADLKLIDEKGLASTLSS